MYLQSIARNSDRSKFEQVNQTVYEAEILITGVSLTNI